MSYRIGIDVGGTFTDLIAIGLDGRVGAAKTPSTPSQPARAVAEGLATLAATLDLDTQALLARTQLIVHGSTAALNALIEHKGARTALLCTAGFRDSLEIRLGAKEKRYDWRYAPPPLLVPRNMRLPIRERIAKTGAVHTPLHEADVTAAVDILRAREIEAVAVCFLWSFRNEAHERRAGELLRAALPDVYVSLSVDVLPEIREYDRTSTTVVNAYIGPIVQRYVARVESMLGELGYRGAVRFMQSNAGLAAAAEVMRRPVYALGSGPAAGPAAGLHHARPHGRSDLISVDMGGTSFDVCLVARGEPSLSKGIDFHRYRLGVSMIDIHAVGAGGGSIARVDAGGLLTVGPASAGAEPGPACYARGGDQATVTDANLILGYLDDSRALGGRIELDRARAEHALAQHIARPLALSLEQAAHAVYAVVNNNMARAIREVSIERGHDPRDFLLVVGGGCGPVHAWQIARELGLSECLIPKVASNFCAFGEVVADIRHTHSRSLPGRLAAIAREDLARTLTELEREGRAALASDNIGAEAVTVTWRFDLRYAGQIYECSVLLPRQDMDAGFASALSERFHAEHEARFAYAERDNPHIELITVGCVVSARQPGVAARERATLARHPRTRPVWFASSAGCVPTPVWDGGALAPGERVAGPAIVEEAGTTIVVFPDCELEAAADAYWLRQSTL